MPNLPPSARRTVAKALTRLRALDQVTEDSAYRDEVHAVENLLEDALNTVSHCDWQGFCSNGHAVSYGTMVVRRSDPYWCESCGEEHDDVLGYNCPDCAAEVKPGVVYSEAVRRVMPTSRSLYLDGEPITKEAFNAIINRELGRQSEAKNQAAIARGRAALGMT